MLRSLKSRLGLIFLAFALIVLTSVGATTWGLEAQRQDALVINLAGRQRMLIQTMSRLALELQDHPAETVRSALQEAESAFGQTLTALRDGGLAPYLPDAAELPGTRDAAIRSALDDMERGWTDFHATLDALIELPPESTSFNVALTDANQQSTVLLQQADLVVRLFQSEAAEKITFLRLIQIGFLLSALALLIAGGVLVHRSLLRPLSELRQAADRLGQQDLAGQVNVAGPEEIASLAGAFEAMRASLQSAQGELIQLNESLERRVAQRTLELEALHEVSREISSQLDLEKVLESITDKARLLLSADVASLCLLEQGANWLNLQALSGEGGAVIGSRVGAQDDFVGSVLSSRRASVCPAGGNPGGCQILSRRYRASHLAAPLRIGERVIGALCVGSQREASFGPEAAETLTKLAASAAVALENARLYTQAEKVAALEERSRIAAEIHDGLGQTLSYLGLMLDQAADLMAGGQAGLAIQRLRHTRERVDQATREVRQAISQLMTSVEANLDLSKALERTVRELAGQNAVQVDWRNELDAPPRCSREMIEQVARVVGEALNNAIHHAGARRILVSICESVSGYQVSVQDDGRGFDPDRPGKDGHFGLQIMRARAAHINGALRIDSIPARGTTVTLEWEK